MIKNELYKVYLYDGFSRGKLPIKSDKELDNPYCVLFLQEPFREVSEVDVEKVSGVGKVEVNLSPF